jgi:glyoxylase-like metal-dependent hydrolase (beta-lactamase superfamily II)/ferredoxin
MARLSERLPENVPGDVYVDATCIDCDTCRQLEPRVYARSDRSARSFVRAQPRTPDERLRALMALVACPTASIGTVSKADLATAIGAFPERITGEVYYNGFTSRDSFGASSYLIRRPEGNVLVDSPRAAGPLIDRIRALGGVRIMFLTHRDDVADHAAFRRAFGCDRVIHERDQDVDTADVEVVLRGEEPTPLAHDLLAIPVPGHTAGSTALLHGDVLFSGDHLWGDGDRLDASRAVAWWSWPEQVRSLRKLLRWDFTWVLPGHGERSRADGPGDMRRRLERLLEELAVARR